MEAVELRRLLFPKMADERGRRHSWERIWGVTPSDNGKFPSSQPRGAFSSCRPARPIRLVKLNPPHRSGTPGDTCAIAWNQSAYWLFDVLSSFSMIICRVAFGVILTGIGGRLAGAASAVEITLPPESAAYRPSRLPGYELVERDCLVCHSAQYVQYQPKSPRRYWDASVRKMKTTFAAPFPDGDIPAIVDYLAQTYGDEKGN